MSTARFYQRSPTRITVATVTHPKLPPVREHVATAIELGSLSRPEREVLAREGVYEIDSRRIYAAKALARLAA